MTPTRLRCTSLALVSAFVIVRSIVTPDFKILFVSKHDGRRTIPYKGGDTNLEIEDIMAVDLGHVHYVRTVTLHTSSAGNISLEIESYWKAKKHSSFCKKPIDFDPSSSRMLYNCNRMGRILRLRGTFNFTFLQINGYGTYSENYVGCYKIKEDEIEIDDSSDLEECIITCLKRKKKWTAMNEDFVKNCLCVDSLTSSVSVGLDMCDLPCGHNIYQNCGRESFYSVYLTEIVGEPLIALMQARWIWTCIHRSFNCPKCSPGRGGYNCDSSDCAVNNGNCGNLRCEIIANPAQYTFCSCPAGYRWSLKVICVDVDECDLYECPRRISECINTMGGYYCRCLVSGPNCVTTNTELVRGYPRPARILQGIIVVLLIGLALSYLVYFFYLLANHPHIFGLFDPNYPEI